MTASSVSAFHVLNVTMPAMMANISEFVSFRGPAQFFLLSKSKISGG